MLTRRSAIAAMVLPFAFAAGQAQALDVGNKGSFADMEAALKNEGQSIIAESFHSTGTKIRGVLYTRNAKDKVAYIIITNNTLDNNPTQAQVMAKLVNTQVFDPRIPGVPAAAKAPAPSAVALAQCEKIRKDGDICGSLNDMLEHADKQGIGVLMIGDDALSNPGGERTRWTLTAKMRNADNDLVRRGRALVTIMPQGTTSISYGFLPLQTNLTTHGHLQLLQPGQKIASLTANPK